MNTELKPLPLRIRVSLDGDPVQTVNVEDYVRAKWKALREFGYSSLTIPVVREQLQHALAGHDMENGLDIIGSFIAHDLVKEEQK